MSTIPSIPSHDEIDLRHPTWCDFNGSCTAPDALAARGVDPRDLPPTMANSHLSKPIRVTGDRLADVELELFAWRGVDQPPLDEVEGFDMVVTWVDRLHMVGVSIATTQITALAEAVDDLAAMVRPIELVGEPDENPVVNEVARALFVLGCITRANADALLGLTVVQLTERERTAVLARFPEDGVWS